MLVPLLKALKKQGKVTIISTSPFKAHEVFNGFEHQLFDRIVELEGNIDMLKHSASFRKKFDAVYLDYFAATHKNLMLAHIVSKKVITNHLPIKLPLLFRKRVEKRKPLVGVHEAVQYLKFAHPEFEEQQLNDQHFSLNAKKGAFEGTTSRYITIQPGSGNNLTPWKTWKLEYWIEVIQWILDHTECVILVLGDDSELKLAEKLPDHERIITLIGQTSLQDLPGIIQGAAIHLGQDSGLMHIAGCVGTKTITIWGGSDPEHFGWEKINSEKHTILKRKLSCQPCNRWIAPNTNKVELSSLCPDFACLAEIKPEEFIKVLEEKFNAC